MNPNLRTAAIKAIKNGDLATLKAIKQVAKDNGGISTYFKVIDEDQLYLEDGTPIESEPDPEPLPKIDGILPMITEIIICFSSKKQMEESFKEEISDRSLLRKDAI